MKHCAICNQDKPDEEIDGKLTGLGATRDSWICKQCVIDSENATKIELAPDFIDRENR